MKKALKISLWVLCFALCTSSAFAQAAYDVTLLGIAGSFGMASVTDLNKWGQIVGQDSNSFNPSALLWTPTVPNGATGTSYTLSSASGFPAGSASSYPSGLNDRGQVTGTAYTPGQGDGNQTQSWMWRPNPLNSSKGVLNGSVGEGASRIRKSTFPASGQPPSITTISITTGRSSPQEATTTRSSGRLR